MPDHVPDQAPKTVPNTTETETVSTFVVKAPEVNGVIEPVTESWFSGESKNVLVSVRNYTLEAKSGEFQLIAPPGWQVSDNGTGTFALSGYTGGVHTNRTVAKPLTVTIPGDAPVGSYQLKLLVTSEGATTESSIIVKTGNYVANASFETDGNGDGLADSWLKMNGSTAAALSPDASTARIRKKSLLPVRRRHSTGVDCRRSEQKLYPGGLGKSGVWQDQEVGG